MLSFNCKNKAFSLLELLVTVAVLTIGIVAILQGESFSARLTGVSGDIIKAVFLAEDKLQEIEFFEKQGWLGEMPFQSEGQSDKYKLNYNIIPEEEIDLYKLDFKVSWQRANRKEQILLSTYLR